MSFEELYVIDELNGADKGSPMRHTFEDAGTLHNEAKGIDVHLQNCTTCLLTVASDIPYDPDCPGEPDPVRQKIWDMTEGLREDIAAALGVDAQAKLSVNRQIVHETTRNDNTEATDE